MATLLSLPTEVLIDIFIASPTTRTLLQLSRANRRMRSIWLEHSHQIVLAKYKPRITHIEQAIKLTLIEAQCAETPSTLENGIDSQSQTAPKDTPTPSPPSLCLPRILRNAGLASSVCDALAKDDRLQKISWQTEDPRIEMLRAYYLIRHTALAYDYSRLRPAIISELTDSSLAMLAANKHVSFFLEVVASVKLRNAHGMYERNAGAWRGTYRDPGKDEYRLVDRWLAVSEVLSQARYNQKYSIADVPSFDITHYDEGDD